MRTIKLNTYKGTRIQVGNEKREHLNTCISMLTSRGYTEIEIPVIQPQTVYANKVGDNKNLMFNFEDRGGRAVCLAPEYTAVIQNLTKEAPLFEKDTKLFYIGECFRGENPQYGRWRQFTQLGVEIVNPTENYLDTLLHIASALISTFIVPSDTDWYKEIRKTMTLNTAATRGLDYYSGPGFEMYANTLGTARQICGGGTYEGGQGFALGIDRLMLLNRQINNFEIFKDEKDTDKVTEASTSASTTGGQAE